MSRKTFTVKTVGVGRTDYSANVEQSVEPLILSWQNEYKYFAIVNTPHMPIATPIFNTTEVILERNTVAILYDFFLSDFHNQLYQLIVSGVTESGAVVDFATKQGNYSVDIHLIKGVPVFGKYYLTYCTYGAVDATPAISVHGMWTNQTEWYGIGVQPTV